MNVKVKKPIRNPKVYNATVRAFDSALADRDGMISSWRVAEDTMYGNHWKGSKMPSYKSKVTSNFFFEAVETTVPIVCARAPEPTIKPRAEQAVAGAEIIGKMLKRIWIVDRMQRKSRECFRTKETYGNGVIKSVKVPGRQKMHTEVVDLFQLLPAPGTSNIEECYKKYLIHAVIMTVGEVLQTYQMKVQPEGDLDNFRSFQWKDQMKQNQDSAMSVSGHDYERASSDPADGWVKAGTESRVDEYTEIGLDPHELSGQVLVIERWWWDPIKQKSMVTTVTRGNSEGEGVILLHTDNPYPRLPFFMEKNYSEPHSFWGRSESAQIMSLIKAENMILSQMTDHIRLVGNPRGEVLRSAGIDPSELTNKPGGYHFSSIQNGFRWTDPPKMIDVLPFLNYLRLTKDNIIGIQDAYRGKANSSSESGVHAQTLAQQSGARLQPKIDEHVEMLRELFEHWFWIITNMYGQQETLRSKDEGGQYTFSEFRGIDYQFEDFDVEIVVGSTLPFDEYEAYNEAKELYTQQLIPPELVIEMAPRLPDKERAKRWLKKMMEGASQSGLTPEEEAIMQGTDQDAIMEVLQAHPELQQQGAK